MPTVTAARRPVNPFRPRKIHVATVPATGSCRWAVQPTESHPGCLVLTTLDKRTGKPVSQAYLVSPVLDGGRLVGWSLRKQGAAEVYDIPADFSSCDCPDGTYHSERPGGCKHARALKAGLKALAN
jgi:hypothetical protein